MSRKILAIEVREDHIAAVLLARGLKTSSVTACVEVPLGSPEESDVKVPLEHCLLQLLEKIDAVDAHVVVSLPAKSVICRSLAVPFKDNAKIRQMLPFALEPLLPLEIDSLTIDFQKSIITEENKVLAVAIANDYLENQMTYMHSVGLRPCLVVPGGIPLAKLIGSRDPDMPDKALILDVDQQVTTLLALQSGEVEMVRCIPFGVEDEPSVKALAQRVRQTMTARADSNGRDVTPEMVYISGSGLRLPGSARRLTEALALPVKSCDISQLLPEVEIGPAARWNGRLMNGALALAHMEAEGTACPNFHRVSSPLGNYWDAYRTFVTGPAILAALVLLLGLGGVLLDSFNLKKRGDALDARIAGVFEATFPDTPLTAAPLDQMKNKLKEAKQSETGPASGGTAAHGIDILLQVSQAIPASIDVVFKQLIIGGGTVTISGQTTGFDAVDEIKSLLEKNAIFNEVSIASANMSKAGDMVRFKLKIDL